MTQAQLTHKRHIACVVLPDFSMLAISACVEAFQACNRISGETRYELLLVSVTDTAQARSDSGITLATDRTLQQVEAQDMHALIICGGSSFVTLKSDVLDWLKVNNRQFEWVAGIASGGSVLAQCGLLAGHKASLLSGAQSISDDTVMVDIHLSQDVFSIDGRFASCRAGTAAMDLMFVLIGREQGKDMLEALAQFFVRERMGVSRVGSDRQLLDTHLRQEQPKLQTAIELMESNIEEPLSTDDLAHHVGLSRRHLERLFNKYLSVVPSRYYLQVRLEKARQLLRRGGMSVTDVAVACGFSSVAHFSTAYRNHQGLTPSEERQQAQIRLENYSV
ncbi:MAG: helix-turn-helix domain-containing protein [Oleiphilaceae bacterium]|nr:helix-turn-helix domain-containing protein [Oleiphilaceae bacterium]